MEMKQPYNNFKDIPQDREKMQPVAHGKKVQENFGRKILSEIIVEDLHNIGEYLLKEVALPAAKNAVSDLVTNFVDMALFGQVRNKVSGNSVKRITPYNSLYGTSTNRVVKYNDFQQQQPQQKTRGLAGYSYQEVMLDSRPEAEDVLARMRIYLDKYGVVSVSDLYDAVGEIPDMMDTKWGWTDLSGAYVQRCAEGFILRMPRVEAI